MKKVLYVLAVVVVAAGGGACAARTDAARPTGESSTGASAALTDTSCEPRLTITVTEDKDGKKTFSPSHPWQVNAEQLVTFVNQTNRSLCINILDANSNNHGSSQPLAADGGSWNDACALSGSSTPYAVGACFSDDCTQLCQRMNEAGHDPGITDTIKGNLSVVTAN
ncbi:hypothetical protein ACLESD_14290 [Pyxidicoccus sp. 3LFB2]